MNTTTPHIQRRAGALAIALFIPLSLGLVACGSDDEGSATTAAASVDSTGDSTGGLSISDPWSRQPAEGQTRTAVYGTVLNGTDETVTVIGATSSVTDTVELHETLVGDDGTMSMQERVAGYEIPAGASFVFEPGGPHVMFFDIDPATYPSEVDVTLEFDNGETLSFTAEVREIGDDMDGDMEMDDDMDMPASTEMPAEG